MNHEILPFSAALMLGLLWGVCSTRLLIRIFGKSAPWNPLKGYTVSLNDGQSMLLAVISFSGSFLVFDLAHRYILWRLCASEPNQLTLDRFLRELVGDLFVGILFGFVSMIVNLKRDVE